MLQSGDAAHNPTTGSQFASFIDVKNFIVALRKFVRSVTSASLRQEPHSPVCV